MLTFQVMIHLLPRSRSHRTSLPVRLLALLLSLGVGLTVPATAMAEGVACAWGMVHQGEHGGHVGEAGTADAASGPSADPHADHHHHGSVGNQADGAVPAGEASSSERPPEPCPCPHPCGPCAIVAGAPAPGATAAFLSHPVPEAVAAWDVPSLPIFDPLLVPSGPDPPASPFLR